MLETYKQFRRSTSEEYVEKTNEELVKIYKEAKVEYERSQSVGALFIKNFPALLKITSRCEYINSADKAGMITTELLNSIEDYNSSTKFITYLTNRAENLFKWNYTNNKNRIDFETSVDSLNRVVRETENEENCRELSDYIEDKSAIENQESLEIRMDIKHAFKMEYATAEDDKRKEQIKFDFSVLRIIFNNPDYTADQIARKLGLFTKKEEYEFKPKAPDITIDYKRDAEGNIEYDKFGNPQLVEKTNPYVRKAQWSKIGDSRNRIKEMFVRYGIVPKNYSNNSVRCELKTL